jgi:hypothetical protein
MTYGPNEAQADIATLENFWAGDFSNYVDVVIAMQNLVGNADTDDPFDTNAAQVKQAFANAEVFIDALIKEPMLDQAQLQDTILNAKLARSWLSNATDDLFTGPPRFYMLKGIADATQASWFHAGDPAGITPWIDYVDPAGDAVMHCLASDPDPIVLGMMLGLLKGTAFPAEWAQRILTGLGGLDATIAAAGWDATTRKTLSAASNDLKARARNAANQATAGSLKAFQTATGQQTQNNAPAPRPWFKRIELWGALFGGVVSGTKIASRFRQRT